MPVTKTAKRALRSSARKTIVNKLTTSGYEVAIRVARKLKSKASVVKAIALVDRAAKKKVIHKNKAARIKGQLSKLVKPEAKKAASKVKTSKKK